jgi:hypothetical protein
VTVNGVATVKEMITEIKNAAVLECLIERAEVWLSALMDAVEGSTPGGPMMRAVSPGSTKSIEERVAKVEEMRLKAVKEKAEAKAETERREAESYVDSSANRFAVARPVSGGLLPESPTEAPVKGGASPRSTKSRGSSPKRKTWDVFVTKEFGSLGLAFNQLTPSAFKGESVLVVNDIKPGKVLDKWNMSNPSFAVQRGDRVVSVNSAAGNAAVLVDLLKSAERVHMSMERRNAWLNALDEAERAASLPGPLPEDVHSWIVTIEKNGGSLGLKFREDPARDVMVITHVEKDGSVAKWNQAHPSQALQPDDRITSANGVQGSVQEIVAEIRAAALLKLVIQRVFSPPKLKRLGTDPYLQRGGGGIPEGSPGAGEEPSRRWVVRVDRGESLGLKLTDRIRGPDGAMALCVTRVKPGGDMEIWNNAEPGLAVVRGDRIVSINGVEGNVGELISQIKNAAALEFVFERADFWTAAVAREKEDRLEKDGRTPRTPGLG